MKVQTIYNQNNISTQALYFPEIPNHLHISDTHLRKVIENNPFINKLSKENDVFARFFDSETGDYLLELDVVDIKAKKTKFSMQYHARGCLIGKTCLLKDKFISEINPPKRIETNSEGNLAEKIDLIDKTYSEENDFYSFSFYGIDSVSVFLWKIINNAPQEVKDMFIQNYGKHKKANEKAMEKIEKFC